MQSYAVSEEGSHKRFYTEKSSDYRSAFQRDRDRILYSGSFRKLQYKTQVFMGSHGDYYRTRLTHTLEVAQIARTIGKALDVNGELVEAISLAHDLGHPPFGHTGEEALDQLSRDFGGFDHNVQVLRLVSNLENIYADFPGLNLTFCTLEGLATHNGSIQPVGLFLKKLLRLKNGHENLIPTIEAQIASISDDIAYNCHDIGDGLRAGLFTLPDLEEILFFRDIIQEVIKKNKKIDHKILCHELVRRTLNFFVQDLLITSRKALSPFEGKTWQEIKQSAGQLIIFSKDINDVLLDIRQFLMERMYRHKNLLVTREQSAEVIKDLFLTYSSNIKLLPNEWVTSKKVLKEGPRTRNIVDYISGMTDRYAIREHSKLFGDYKKKYIFK